MTTWLTSTMTVDEQEWWYDSAVKHGVPGRGTYGCSISSVLSRHNNVQLAHSLSTIQGP